MLPAQEVAYETRTNTHTHSNKHSQAYTHTGTGTHSYTHSSSPANGLGIALLQPLGNFLIEWKCLLASLNGVACYAFLLLFLPQLQLQLQLEIQLQLQTGKLAVGGKGPTGGGRGSCVRRQICVATRQNCKTSTSNSSQVLSVPGTNSAALSSPYLSLLLLLILFLLSGYYKFAISLLPFLQPSLMSFLCLLLAALL